MTEPDAIRPVILVVDDNAENRALALATLEDDYRVVMAANGEEALRSVAAESPECVVLDVNMPGMNGFEVCAQIRALSGHEQTPVVFLTALRDVETFDAALRAGGDDFLTKPVRPTELVLRVQAALRVGRLNAANREYYELARRQRDDLMRLQLQKERLTAFVVHDLKNPVGVVDLHAQVLLRDKELSPRARASATAIREEVRSLLRLIMNLLDISKSEEGKLVPAVTELSFATLAAEVMETASVAARAKGVTLKSELGAASVRADPDLLRRVLENLLDNALRHAPEDSAITLSSSEREGQFEARIADEGGGVPAEMRERIFDPFVQVESTDRSVTRSGRGLGLAFCRLAVEAHGGRLWVEEGRPGAVFCMRLPHG